MAFVSSGPCSCYIAYVYPTNTTDGRRWFVAKNAENKLPLHNHFSSSEWQIAPNVLCDITKAAQMNINITPKEVQNGAGLDYRPTEVSMAAANIDQIRNAAKKARKEVDKVDNERVNPFKIIASFPAIKE